LANRNFELARVKSINTSGHKYGLVYPGLGWIVYRDVKYLPTALIFELAYLGGIEQSFTLNFSRPGSQVVLQYYNLIHLGAKGYREIMENCLANARLLAKSLEATGWYTVISDIHRPVSGDPASVEPVDSVRSVITQAATSVVTGGDETSANYVAGLPVVSFRFSDTFRASFPHIQQETVSLLLRSKQWIIPNYALPPNEEKTEILRVVVRESMSLDLLDRLITDIVEVTETLMENDQIDLSMIQTQKRKVELKTDKKEHDQVTDLTKNVGERVGRMADGIHRSVC
jgi:glutamate decarboxylase